MSSNSKSKLNEKINGVIGRKVVNKEGEVTIEREEKIRVAEDSGNFN